MSLYYETASFLSARSLTEGSLKSLIFRPDSNLKSNPATIYALLSETTKYDSLLKEVIDNAGILVLEPKLTPILSLLLVHDHLLSKNGIAAPTNHPLRLAVERHKARLQAELTKCRIRRGCASIGDLRKHVAERTKNSSAGRQQPRWVRVNRLRSTIQQQMSLVFSRSTLTARLVNIRNASAGEKLVYIDQHIPDLLALPPGTELTKTEAYKTGQLILQDKASCFPASLLLESPDNYDCGDILDACAAPGNKTTHLASMLFQQSTMTNSVALNSESKIFACERDQYRSQTLQKMVFLAGAEKLVTVLAKQDFLALDPSEARFKNVTHLLLDPSCSGSGIVGRDEMPVLQLPNEPKLNKAASIAVDGKAWGKDSSKKRKLLDEPESNGTFRSHGDFLIPRSLDLESEEVPREVDFTRLEKLANLQSKIIEHAFSFPAAKRISYSTCSIHIQENEAVVSRTLRSDVARNRGWRIMRQEEQPNGLKKWPHRGLDFPATESVDVDSSQKAAIHGLTEQERQACIRCHAGDEEGTMGFFLCGFIREGVAAHVIGAGKRYGKVVIGLEDDVEWEGFSDDAGVQPAR